MNTLLTRVKALVHRVFFWLPGSAPSDEHAPDVAHDHALILAVTAPRKVPRWRQLRYVSLVLSIAERRTFFAAILLALIGGGGCLALLFQERTIRVPSVGGTVTEALIGEPRHVNPLDAPANDVDQDLSSLIYSGLFRMNGMSPEPDLAEKFTWSDDGKTLTVTIRGDSRFQNGDPVTADDVQFTIDAIQDPARSSPLAPFFRGVKAVATDTQTIQFMLDHADVSFLTALTVGILPSSLWQDIPGANARLADINLHPVGSGPYRFKSFTRDSKGFLRSFTLERFGGYYGVKPYVTTLVFQFFPDRKQAEDALKGDLVDALAFSSPADTKNSGSSRWTRVNLDLPQETVAFFNLKSKLLSDERVRRALAGVIDRQEIIDAWHGHASAVSGPFPFGQVSSAPMTLDAGRALLDAAGWKPGAEDGVRTFGKAATSTAVASSTTFSLTIIAPDQPELLSVAEALKRRWSLIGARITIVQKTTEELVHAATRERQADVVLSNVLLGPDQDVFPFWWSGQAVDRGLNISSLTDRDVDAALEASSAATTTIALAQARARIDQLVTKSTPAAFLVRPSSPYLVAKHISGVSPQLIVSQPADRLQDMLHWYVKTSWRWK